MLSYINLGKEGYRLGNQLFQYAFLRTEAEKLGVKFYCPRWIGDEIFDLNDQDIRINNLMDIDKGIQYYYKEYESGDFSQNPIVIKDNTDISGHFESEKCFDKDSISKWYKFKESKIFNVLEKYKDIDFKNAIAVHLRLGDKLHGQLARTCFYVPRKMYYKKSLEILLKPKASLENVKDKTILIFSDEIELAKKYFNSHDGLIFIEGNKDWEDLYLMSRCRDIICSASTFSWWVGYLNQNPSKKVIFPKERLWRPKFSEHEVDLIPDSWIKVRGLYPIIDNYFFVRFIIDPVRLILSLIRK
jgi:hypothetical protein